MKRILAALAAMVLLSGCLGSETQDQPVVLVNPRWVRVYGVNNYAVYEDRIAGNICYVAYISGAGVGISCLPMQGR